MYGGKLFRLRCIQYSIRNSEIHLNDRGDNNIHELTQREVAEDNSNANDVVIQDKIVFCLNDVLKEDLNEVNETHALRNCEKSKHLYDHMC